MMTALRRAIALGFAALLSSAIAAPEPALPLALRQVDPAKLSGGTFAAFDAQGLFGSTPPPLRATTGYPDLSKGRPPAVLDARVGANVRLGDDPAALPATQRGQAEPHLARSTTNPDTLLACFQDGRLTAVGGALACGYAVSLDGGLSWRRALIPQLSLPSGGPYFRATDPVAAIGPQGEMYLNTLAAIDAGFTQGAVVVSRSTDNGATWTAPVEVFRSPSAQVFPDKNWFAVNTYAGTPNPGRLVVTWTSFTSNANGIATGNNLAAAVSDDRGATWSAPIAVTPAGSNNQGSLPLFLPDGTLALVYVEFIGNSSTQFSIRCKRSPDGGRTFPATATTVVSNVIGWDDPEMRDGVFLPSASVARTSGEIFVSYTSVVAGTPRVFVTKSADSGATWSTPVIASDNPLGGSVMNPTIAATADGRTLSVVFMDKRLAPALAGFVDHFVAISVDGGTTWQPNLRLTEMSSDIRYGPLTSRGVMLGDYLGLVPPMGGDSAAVAVWCETRTGDADPFSARFVPEAEDDFAAWSAARRLGRSFAENSDGDAYSNYAEFIFGSDPRIPADASLFSATLSSSTTLDIVWAQRSVTEVNRSGFAVLANQTFPASGVLLGQPISLLPPVALTTAQLPSSPLAPGLVWRGDRYVFPSGSLLSIARTLLITTGRGREIEGTVELFNTDTRLINVSTRAQIPASDRPLIVGFVLDGNKTMLVRGAGPALTALGVTGALADPQLRLQALASDIDLTNDNWQQGGTFAASAALFARLGAFSFAAGSRDAALTLPLGPQAYTAILTNTTGAAGVGLVEAYDADPTPGAAGSPRLLNLSTRAETGAGENALVAGFVLRGTRPRRVLIRAVGPTLAGNFGIARPLADPQLTLYRDSTAIAMNDDWEIGRAGPAIAATAQRVGAFALNAASLDAALLVTLAPGAYTAVVTGVDGATGVALVEIYDAD